jgi:hypothetical protein
MGYLLFTLGSGLKITEVVHIFAYFFHSTSYVLIFTKNIVWATFGATFSQTHLVALPT